MVRLDSELKWGIVSSIKRHGNASKCAREMKVSRESVLRWWTCYKATKTVDCKKPRGRQPSLSPEAADAALEMITEQGAGGAKAVAVRLRNEGITSKVLPKQTVIRAIRRAAADKGEKLVAHKGKPKKGLTANSKAKRLAFALANKTRNWASVMFTDRKRFHFAFPGSVVKPVQWKLASHDSSQHAVYQPNHTQTVNLYCGLTKFGVTACHLVAGTSKLQVSFTNKKGDKAKNITAAQYRQVMKDTLLPKGAQRFSHQGISTWTFQQDNDPTHNVAAQEISAYNTRRGSSVQLLENWPPNSPDLNIIENLWAYVQAKVDARACSSFELFQQAVLEELQFVPEQVINNLFKSLPKRMKAVIGRGGDKTKY
jgi:DDE superfamily endonuclease